MCRPWRGSSSSTTAILREPIIPVVIEYLHYNFLLNINWALSCLIIGSFKQNCLINSCQGCFSEETENLFKSEGKG